MRKGLAVLALLAATRVYAQDPATCLARTIYYEAAGEPYAGKVAVGQVVLNRAAGDATRVCSVVYKRAVTRDGKKVAAFSWTLGRAWRIATVDSRVYARCADIARRMLAGSLRSYLIDDKVRYYHAAYVHPGWKYRLVARIGAHDFYRQN